MTEEWALGRAPAETAIRYHPDLIFRDKRSA